jgi:DNA-binding MarR family transcriptional regulator
VSHPNWLDPEELRAWRTFIEATQLLFDRLDRQLQQDSGLSHADYELLVRLSEATGQRMRMSELAGQTLFSRSRLSHAITRLERAGWVRREGCPSDKRGTFAVLTAAGRRVLECAAPGHAATVRHHLFDQLTLAQQRQLQQIASRIRDRLDHP